MKVLLINSVCGIRSTGRICTDLAEVLESNGHTCKIAYGRETVPEKYHKYAVRIGSDISIKIDALKTRLFDNAGFNSVSATKKFIKWVKEYDPDVIHLHNLHGYYINIGILFEYLRNCGKKVIWTLHDCWAFTGHCSHFVTANCERWKKQCYCCPKRKAYPSSLFLDCSKRNYGKKKKLFTSLENMTIITPSEWLANLVKQSFLDKYKIQVINNGIDVDIFKPTDSNFREEYGLFDKKIVLGVASAWGENKGFYDFIKLSELLDNNYQIILIGLNEIQLKELPSKIIGITRTNNIEELAKIYSAADVFVNPTYCDTYPTVNLEAQACGTPVITYKTGGSVESVPPENVVEISNIGALVKNIDKELKISDRCFSKKEMLNKYLKVID